MDNIIEPTKSFDFSKLSLAHPIGVQGGAYFTKIEYNNKPLYIQTVKSLTRQGLVKNGKKYYCDLMFDNNSEALMHWFETLEETCHKLIFEKKNDWFQGSLEENDIESAFNSLIRIYKSGKYYLLRTNIKNTKDDIPSVKIYNENELSLGINDITSETSIISILEIHGIKFTSRSFQIEVELKQIMVLNNEPTFESCLIKTNKHIQGQTPLEILRELNEPNQKNLNTIVTLGINDIVKETINIDELNYLEEDEPELEDTTKEENATIETIDIKFEELLKEDNIKENNNELIELNNDLYLYKNETTMI